MFIFSPYFVAFLVFAFSRTNLASLKRLDTYLLSREPKVSIDSLKMRRSDDVPHAHAQLIRIDQTSNALSGYREY